MKRIINKFFYLISALILIFTTSCKRDELSTEDLFENTIPKLVEIKVSTDNEAFSYATGFYIKDNGYILTNKHVVYNETYNLKYNYVYTRSAFETEFTQAEIVDISSTYDLAIIKTNREKCSTFSLTEEFKIGEEVFTIGNPLGSGLSFSGGYISSQLKKINNSNANYNVLQTSLVISEGNSGGPLFNKKGEAIGIISFRLKETSQNASSLSYAVPSIYINEYINSVLK